MFNPSAAPDPWWVSRSQTMHARIRETIREAGDEASAPDFELLFSIYEGLGLDPDLAESAAGADLACGWVAVERSD